MAGVQQRSWSSPSAVPPYARWDRVAQFKPYGGIRIEDDVMCTEGEPLNLTREGFAAG